jgi:hypothetical protein
MDKMGSAVLFWVLQRNAQTDTLITYRPFDDYAEALKHKAELDATAQLPNHTIIVTIEALPVGEVPKSIRRSAAKA